MNRYWFKPKRYGYGASPSIWQGWIATAAYIVVVLAATRLIIPAGRAESASAWTTWLIVVAIATLVFIVLCYLKTDGSWRWRWSNSNSNELS